MTDLLQQAVDGLSTHQRESVNLDLARILNCEHLLLAANASWPSFELRYVVRRAAEHELTNMIFRWDNGFDIRGLA